MADNFLDRVTAVFSKRAAPTETIGTTRDSGTTERGEGAGSFDAPNSNQRLNGTQRFDEYARITRDVAIVAAGVRLLLNLIGNAVWSVNPPTNLNDNEKPIAQDYADQMYAFLFGMDSSWASVVRKTAGFRFHGFAILEWTARHNDDGTIGLKDIAHRPQKTITHWNRDENGAVESVVQRVSGRQDVTLPREKIVYAVDDTLTDSPEGIGLFSHIAITAGQLEDFLAFEKTGFKTDLRGIPIVRAPLGELKKEVTSAGEAGSEARQKADANRNALLEPLRGWLRKHSRNEESAMLISSDTYKSTGTDKSSTPTDVPKWSMELLSGDSQSFPDIANAINRKNQELARILGCEHLMLGADGSGSLALAKSKVGTFYMTVTATMLDLCEIFDKDVLAPISELNGWPKELRPQMGCNEISDRDIEQVMDALEKLARAGAPVMPDDPAVGELYDLLGLTRPPERMLDDEDDLALMPADPDPANPDQPLELEDELEKVRTLRSRTSMAKNRKRRA